MWYRVFGMTDVEVQPAELLEHLRQAGITVQAHHFRGVLAGWFEAELVVAELALTVSRFLATEDGVRADLNAWAAWVEQQEDNPHHDHLMRQLIGVQQYFTAEVPDLDAAASPLAPLARTICRFLADRTGGFYQVDGRGFFAVDGTLLIAE